MSAGEPRLAIDFVSPLPPVRSGIADYSADLLPALAERCDVRVIRLDDQEVAPEVERRWRPVPAEQTGAAGRLPFYQMGNNRYHSQVLDLALARPGVVTLHDLFLHHLLFERTLAHGDHEPYREALRFDHGWIGEAVAEPPRWGAHGLAQLFELPCHRRLVQSQRGVIVHSSWAADRLREEVEGAVVRVIPMPMPLEEPPDAATHSTLRERLAIPTSAPVLGSFGFQTPIKRTDVVLAALARPQLRDAHLLAVGEVAGSFDLAGRAAELGVADRVHLCGYLDRAELAAAMAAVDLCVNLRYPTAGETSASLLRLLAMGRPTLVSDYAQFAELPDDCVVKVPLGSEEVAELARRARTLLDAPEGLAAMATRAREWIRRDHDPRVVAGRLAEALEELAARDPGRPSPNVIPPPTSLTWGETSGELEIAGTDAWAVGECREVAIRLTNRSICRWLNARRGPGGVSLRLELRDAETGVDHLADHPWTQLPRDLEPGRDHIFRVAVRRPPGARLSLVATAMLTSEPRYLPLAVPPCRVDLDAA